MNTLKHTYILILLAIAFSSNAFGQTVTVSKTYAPSSPAGPFTNTTGTPLPHITFVDGVDVPTGAVIEEMEVTIVWSKSDGTACGTVTGQTVDLTEAGFTIEHMTTGLSRTFASSVGIGPFLAPSGGATFFGANPVLMDTSTFKEGGNISVFPHAGNMNNTFSPNPQSLTALKGTDFLGSQAAGDWRILAIDDFPGAGPQLCIHSYTITLKATTSCSVGDVTLPTANCQSSIDVYLDASGIATILPNELDNGSTDNCGIAMMQINNQTIWTVDCSNIGVNTVQLTVIDTAGNSTSCPTVVNVLDTITPVIDCGTSFPGPISRTLYADNTGHFTFLATDSIVATDNCFISSYGVRILGGASFLSSVTLDCSNLGNVPLEYQVTDASGNTSTCTTVISYLDTIAPTVNNCWSTTGSYPIMPFAPLPQFGTGTDNCMVDTSWVITKATGIVNFNDPAYSCNDVFLTPLDTLVLVVVDNSGNVDSSCKLPVEVIDMMIDQVLCQNITVQVGHNNTVTVLPNDIDGGSFDMCGPINYTFGDGSTSIVYDTSDSGTNPLTLVVTDIFGNIDSCSATVTVVDTTTSLCVGDVTPPTANCQSSVDIYLNASGVAIIMPNQIDNGSTDNCGISFMQINNQTIWAVNCSNIGVNTVQFTVFDQAGNSSMCPAVVNVLDTVAPTTGCRKTPVMVQLDPNGYGYLSGTMIDSNSFDNCGIVNTMINNNTSAYEFYYCNHVGTNIANYIVMDGSGNTDTCQATIEVIDITPPNIICQNLTVYIGGNAVDSITPGDIDNGSSDNCGIASLSLNGLSAIVYDTSDAGTQTVTLVAIDLNGNMSNCLATLTVVDTTGQNNCQIAATVINNVSCFGGSDGDAVATVTGATWPTTYLWSHGETHAMAQNLIAGSYTVSMTDANGCTDQATVVVTEPAPLQVTVTTTPSHCSSNDGTMVANATGGNFGGYFYQWQNGQTDQTLTGLSANYWNRVTVTDWYGCSATDYASVATLDTTAPTISCYDTTLYLDQSGYAYMLSYDWAQQYGSDDCGISWSMFASMGGPTAFYDCSSLGTMTETIIVYDAANNSDSCSFNLTIADTVMPTVICQNHTVYVGSNNSATIYPSDIDGGSTDNCGILSMSINGIDSLSYSTNDVGVHNVILSVIDISGNIDSCHSNITVVDTTGQNNCQVVATTINNASCYGVADGAAVASGNGSFPITYQWSSGQTGQTVNNLAAGTHTVTMIDVLGCTDQYTIIITEPAPITTIITSTGTSCGVNNGTLTATTTGGTPPYIYQWSNNQTTATVTGLAANNWYSVLVTDVNNCTSYTYGSVPSFDTTPPTISCSDTTLYLDANGSAYMISFDWAQQYGSDNCGITWSMFSSMNGPTAVYNCTQLGTMTETIVVYDAANNADSCSFNLTILDTIAPVANCQIYTAYVSGANTAVVNPSDINNGSTDNCALGTMLINGSSVATYTTSNLGYNPVTLTVLDASGNSSTCNTWVNVIDTSLAPVANCVGSYTAYLNNSGYAIIDNNDIDNGSLGNNIIPVLSGPLGFSTSFMTVNCNNAGSYNYDFIVIDGTSQQDTCSFILNVVDTIAPVANCQTVFTLPLIGTSATLSPADLNAGSMDNCAITNMYVNGQASLNFDCNDVGTAQWVVLTVEDAAGNTSSCQTLVYIMGGSCGVQASLVSTTPSDCDTSLCTGAVTVTAAGGQNPYTFLWNDGNTDANRTGLCPTTYTVIVTDVNSDKDTLSVTVGYAQGCVWPGDADDDAQVNNMDLLPIALAYGAPGFTRPNASLVWKGQSAPDWNIANPVPNLPDYKHIDCDGSALIDLTDVNAITQNYGLSYVRSNSSKSGNIPFYVESDTAYENDRVGLSVFLGETSNLATDVYGVAFTINYDPMVVEFGSASMDYTNSWLGANLISVQKDFHSQGKIETAVARINHINTSGFGQVGTFYITIRDDVLRAPIAHDMPINITNVRLIDKDNNIIGTSTPTGILTVLEILTSTTEVKDTKNSVAIYPNPSDGNITIKGENVQLEHLKVLSITGQTIFERPLNGQSSQQIQLNDLPNGSYILSITTDQDVLNEQIIIRH
ncbi:MAG: HYR domain-containing protein [Aureispira sp.]|nr:HYR domain-containing protein [Aureispira sp.]